MPNLNRLSETLTQNLSMNKARINCLSLMVIALITAQSSNLKKNSKTPSCGKTDSHYRRLQRFFSEARIDYDQLALMIYRLFGLGKVTLTIDRTNWKWGKSNLNIFMLGVVYKGIAIPLYWQMLDKRGNTNHLERCELIERFIKQFGKDNLEMIVADREFVGEKWFNWLTNNHIPFAIRIKKNSKVKNHHGKLVQIKELLRHVSHQETYRHGRILTVDGCLVRVFAKRDKDYGLVIVATNQLETVDAMTSDAKRWEIETLFACLKGRGFNLEDTHLTHLDRVSKLVAVNALAFCWAYHVGIYKDKDKPLKRKLNSNARPQASLFALGLDVLIEGLRLVFFNNDKTVFRQLVSFLTPKPMKIRWG